MFDEINVLPLVGLYRNICRLVLGADLESQVIDYWTKSIQKDYTRESES